MDKLFDVAIIGSGPAGLSAARLANQLGLKFVLIDEQRQSGGNVYRNYWYNATERSELARVLGSDYVAAAQELNTDFLKSENCILNAQVFSIDQNGEVAVKQNGQAFIVKASKILIATGAMERPTPLPGWTLPGVMSVGAVQTLLKDAAVIPKGRSVFVGSGPLVLLVAHQFLKHGIPPAAVVLTGPLFGRRASFSSLLRALHFSGRLLKGLAWLTQIVASKIDVYSGATNVRILGESRASGVRFHSKTKDVEVPADNVFVHEGLVLNTMLAMSADCEHVWDAAQRCWTPKLDEWGQTTAENLYVAGDSARILGAHAAAPSATRAMLSIASSLGHIGRKERDKQGAKLSVILKREKGFREFLDRVYPPPSSNGCEISDQTVVCRCENVTAGQIRALSELKCTSISQAKAYTRCGMGPCQGRMCGLPVAEIMAESQNRRIEDIGHFRVRAPIRHITLGELASFHTNDEFSILDMRK